MDPEKRESLKEIINKDNNRNTTDFGNDKDVLDADRMRALALEFAKFLEANDLRPGEDPAVVTETETGKEQGKITEPAREAETSGLKDMRSGTESAEMLESTPEADSKIRKKEKKSPAAKKSAKKPAKKPKKKPSGSRLRTSIRPELTEEETRRISEKLERRNRVTAAIASAMDFHDRLTDKMDDAFINLGRDLTIAWHRIASTYRNSRRAIGLALLAVGVITSVILVIFDKHTVYEYSYNGKVLGYVKNQEEVTDVLEVAGKRLSENSGTGTEIKFTANQNVTFKLIEGRGKSLDNTDIAVNKLVYMTDIETEAYGVFDGEKMVAVVKSREDAETLLGQTRTELSTPDRGMELVSAEFTNDLSVKPLNVLLTSVQSNTDARKIMTNGGALEIYHIVEEGESLTGIAENFGVEPKNIYDEKNKEIATETAQGDTICVHISVEPVSVKMVETGRMREIIEYETVKKESDKYYKGDTFVEQEGVNGVQIFEGTITKVAGEVTDRKESAPLEVLRKKKDKIILVGTAERPKTAPTGTYIVPLYSYEGITSNFGQRWGRLHSGIDMGASRGTTIHAADGGTVRRAGWYAGYGLCVDIDHGNGTFTRYGHCSALYVNVGDLVYQGQEIAAVGNTGRSFGNHLHFEININGSPVNPRPYLGL